MDTLELWEVHQNLSEIYGSNDLYESTKHSLIHGNFLFHMENNKQYASYVNSSGINAHSNKFKIEQIPLLPSGFFKAIDLNLNSCSSEQVIKTCTSSGTMGSISRVDRDEDTLSNFFSSVSSSFEIFYGLKRSGNHKVLVLGPSNEEAGNLWFSYVLSSMALQFETYFYETNGVFEYNKLINKIIELSSKSEEMLIIGPPFRIFDLSERIKEEYKQIPFYGNSYIISGGGWKIHSSRSVNRESYNETVRSAFGLEDNFRIRDSYNMVELNTVINECEFNLKHIPPWMDVIARDPRTNDILPDGNEGLLSFIDSSSLSYPCYILTEDYGVVSNDRCKCGNYGKRIEITKRMEKVEARGCALKMSNGSHVSEIPGTRYFDSQFRIQDNSYEND